MQTKNRKERTHYVEKVQNTHETWINRENEFFRSQKHQRVCHFEKLMKTKYCKINYKQRFNQSIKIANNTFSRLQKFYLKKIKNINDNHISRHRKLQQSH